MKTAHSGVEKIKKPRRRCSHFGSSCECSSPEVSLCNPFSHLFRGLQDNRYFALPLLPFPPHSSRCIAKRGRRNEYGGHGAQRWPLSRLAPVFPVLLQQRHEGSFIACVKPPTIPFYQIVTNRVTRNKCHAYNCTPGRILETQVRSQGEASFSGSKAKKSQAGKPTGRLLARL